MKTWLKSGLIIGFIGAIIGTIRLYFKFSAMNKALQEGLGNLAQFASPGGNTITAGMYIINFIQWFIVCFVIGIIIGLIIQKVMD